MAVEIESDVMRGIGLGSHYSYYNGSGGCGGRAKSAVGKLSGIAMAHGLEISQQWLERCNLALEADLFDDGNYTLTNTWVACSDAIRDACERCNGGVGFAPPSNGEEFHFFYNEKRAAWERQRSYHTRVDEAWDLMDAIEAAIRLGYIDKKLRR